LPPLKEKGLFIRVIFHEVSLGYETVYQPLEKPAASSAVRSAFAVVASVIGSAGRRRTASAY